MSKYYNFIDRQGEVHFTKEGYEIEIIEYTNYMKCTIRFKDSGYIRYDCNYGEIKNKSIRNPYHPTVYNTGYFGIGSYKSSIDGKHTNYYRRWKNLLFRCYSSQRLDTFPTYKDVTVCEEWHNFQNFAKWHEENWESWMDSSWDLDKDLLIRGNRIYSPETCCFIPKEINGIFKNTKNNRGVYPISVKKDGNRFCAKLNSNHIASFMTIEEAFQAAKTAKEAYIKDVADKWKPFIKQEAHKSMYKWTIEITD